MGGNVGSTFDPNCKENQCPFGGPSSHLYYGLDWSIWNHKQIEQWCCFEYSLACRLYSTKSSIGPKMELWGTPDKTGNQSEFELSTTTLWCLPIKYALNHLRCEWNPKDCNLWVSNLWETLSNASEKPKYNMSTFPAPSKMELISWKTVTSCITVDLSLTKPCWRWWIWSLIWENTIFNTAISVILPQMHSRETGQ